VLTDIVTENSYFGSLYPENLKMPMLSPSTRKPYIQSPNLVDRHTEIRRTSVLNTGTKYRLQIYRDAHDGSLHLPRPSTVSSGVETGLQLERIEEKETKIFISQKTSIESDTSIFLDAYVEERPLRAEAARGASSEETKLAKSFSSVQRDLLDPVVDSLVIASNYNFAAMRSDYDTDMVRHAFLMGPMMLEDVGLLAAGRAERLILPQSDPKTMTVTVGALLGAAVGNYYHGSHIRKYFPSIAPGMLATDFQLAQTYLGHMWLCVAVAQAEIENIPRDHTCNIEIDFSVQLRKVTAHGARPFYERTRSLTIHLTDAESDEILKSTVIASEAKQSWFCEQLPPRSAIQRHLA
jgi:hypothetical protein